MNSMKKFLTTLLVSQSFCGFAQAQSGRPESVTRIPNFTSWGENYVTLSEFKLGPYEGGSNLLYEGAQGECTAQRARVLPSFLAAKLPEYVTNGPLKSGLKYVGKKISKATTNCSESVAAVQSAIAKAGISPSEFKCVNETEFMINPKDQRRDSRMYHNFGMSSTYMDILSPRGNSHSFVYQPDGDSGHLYSSISGVSGAGSYNPMDGILPVHSENGYAEMENPIAHLRRVKWSECLQGTVTYGRVVVDSLTSFNDDVGVFVSTEDGYITGDVEKWKKEQIAKWHPNALQGLHIYRGNAYYFPKGKERVQRIQPVIDAVRESNLCGICADSADQVVPSIPETETAETLSVD